MQKKKKQSSYCKKSNPLKIIKKNIFFTRIFVIHTYDSLLPFNFKLHTFHILTRSMSLFLSHSKYHSSLEHVHIFEYMSIVLRIRTKCASFNFI